MSAGAARRWVVGATALAVALWTAEALAQRAQGPPNALQGFSQTLFFYGALEGVFYDPALAPLVSRDNAVATRTIRGGSAFGIYPFDRYRRLEVSGGFVQLREEYTNEALQFLADWRWEVWGSIVILVMIFRPQGILGRDTLNLRRWIRPRLVTPA